MLRTASGAGAKCLIHYNTDGEPRDMMVHAVVQMNYWQLHTCQIGLVQHGTANRILGMSLWEALWVMAVHQMV